MAFTTPVRSPGSPKMRGLRLAVTAWTALCGCSGPADGTPGSHAAHGARPVRVSVAPVRFGALERDWVLYGEARAGLRAQLAAGAEGRVTQVFVREGEAVTRGTKLLQIDGARQQARVSAAEAARRQVSREGQQAERELSRYKEAGTELVAALEIERAASAAARLSAETATKAAELQEAAADLRLNVIRAPFDGTVAARSLDPGDWASVGAPALELVALDRLEIVTFAPAALLPSLSAGQAAKVRTARGTVDARVVGLVRALDPKTRTAVVRLALSAPDDSGPRPPPGAAVEVVFRAPAQGEGLIVPRDALVEGPQSQKVWRVVDGEPAVTGEAVNVEVLARGTTEVLVSGERLSQQDRVVVRGNERLRPGAALVLEEL